MPSNLTLLLLFSCLSAVADPILFNVRDYGATGLQQDDATAAINQTIQAARAAGGGTVLLPTGDYSSGAIVLFDNITLQIEAGAVLYVNRDHPTLKAEEGFIYAEKARNIAIRGRGKIDGQATYRWGDYDYKDVEIEQEVALAKAAGVEMKRSYRTGKSVFMLLTKECDGITIDDVTFINSTIWCMRIWGSNHVTIRGITIASDLKLGVNSDGIDLDGTSNVHISGCNISTGDDAICLKTGTWDFTDKGQTYPTENIIVDNCLLTSSSTALMIGTETFSPVRHVLFSNCVIRHSNKAMGINVQDGALVSDIKFSNLTVDLHRRHWNWWGDAEVFYFVLKKRTPTSPIGTIRNITIDNVVAYAQGTSRILTTVDKPLENIRLSNVQIFMEPEDTPDKRTHHAMRFESVDGLTLDNIAVRWNDEKPEPAWQSGIVLNKVDNLELRRVSARQAHKTGTYPAITLTNCTNALLTECVAQPGTGTYLSINGSNTRNLLLHTNYLTNAKTPVIVGKDVPAKVVSVR